MTRAAKNGIHWVHILVFALLSFYLMPLTASAETDGRRAVLEEGADYYGGDYKTLRDITLEACSKACIDDGTCQAFTYNKSANWCFLKESIGALQPAEGAVAGSIRKIRLTPAPENTRPIESLGFISQSQIQRSDDLKSAFDRQVATKIIEDVRAEAETAASANDFPAMRRHFEEWVIADIHSYEAWMGFADTYWRSRSKKRRENRHYRSQAVSATLQAYRLATTDIKAAEALDLLARILVLSENFRPALEAYKASLALAEVPSVRADYAALDKQHGFRMLGYTVDSDAATPRVCIQFSEALDAEGVEYTDYVRLSSREPSDITASGKQLCIGALEHGQSYGIDLRSGLPAAIGEMLKDDVDLKTYVRDRAPQVGFTGNGYVLSRSNSRGVPILTVNLDAVDIEILRVDDPAMPTILRGGEFGQGLSAFEAERLTNDLGTSVWSGTLEIDRVLNKDTVTLMPVFQVLGALQPGAYVMMAGTRNDNRDGWRKRATQWFVVSDLGLSSLSADDGLHVSVKSLETTEPLTDVALKLMARNGEVLATSVSDETGYARFAPGLLRGKGGLSPLSVVAETEAADYAVIDLTKSGFDLTDRGVSGRPSPGALDVFMTTERGIYRPGAPVHMTALLRGPSASALSDVPMTLIIRRPDGVEFDRQTLLDDVAGGFNYSFELPGNAPRGTWNLALHADPDAASLASQRILVEDFVPERIDFDLTLMDTTLRLGEPASLSVDARYLFGVPASNLGFEGEIIIRSKQPNTGPHAGFVFGLTDQRFNPIREPVETGVITDVDGKATIPLTLPSAASTTLPLEATLRISMRDGGGRPVEREISAPIQSDGDRIGVKSQFGYTAASNAPADFRLVALDSDGAAIAMDDVRYQLERLETTYHWYRNDNGRWGWERSTRAVREQTGNISISEDGSTRLSVPVKWGRYRLQIMSDEAVTSMDFYAGWYVEKTAFDTPDALQVGLDQPAYKAGTEAELRLSSERGGRLDIWVANETLLARHQFDVEPGNQIVKIPVEQDWGAGAYVLATLYHPLDPANAQMPSRSIGVEWLKIDSAERTLAVTLNAPDQIRSRETLTLPVSVAGFEEGPAYIVVSAVDIGILNLTGFQTPRPENWYFAQRRLGAVLRDIYGALIDGLTGVEGRLRVGGDAATAGLSMQGNPPAEKSVALYSGIVDLDENGAAEVTLDIPQFNGSLRLMAMAWSADKLGSAEVDIIVRDPVVMTTTMPRFMQPGDNSRLLVQFDNTDGPSGDYSFSVSANAHVSAQTDAGSSLRLERGQSASLAVPLKALNIGEATLVLTLLGPNETRVEKQLLLPVVTNAQPITLVESEVLPPITSSGRRLFGQDALSDFVPGTGVLSVAIGEAAGFNPAALFTALQRYAYRCAEQTVSRAYPLLMRAGGPTGSDRAAVDEAITQLSAYQVSTGAFGLWRANGDQDIWLNAYVTDFLLQAAQSGFEVPDTVLNLSLSNLENTLSFNTNIERDGVVIAHTLYVLARDGRASLGDLRYFADARLSAFATPLSQAQLAASLALYGEQERATGLFEKAIATSLARHGRGSGFRDYGSYLRDGAAILALISESGVEGVDIAELSRKVAAERQSDLYLSTQEMAWLLRASTGEAKRSEPLKIDASHGGMQLETDPDGTGARLVDFSFTDQELAEFGTVRFISQMEKTLPMQVVRQGVPLDQSAPKVAGFVAERVYYHQDGTIADLSRIQQDDRLIALVTVTQLAPNTDQLLLVDPLPAGLEIENPNLLSSGGVAGVGFLPKLSRADFTAFLDDRFVAGFNGKTLKALVPTDGSNVWRFAYRVRAVSPGQFTLPGTHVEDMYRPELSGTAAAAAVTIQ